MGHSASSAPWSSESTACDPRSAGHSLGHMPDGAPPVAPGHETDLHGATPPNPTRSGARPRRGRCRTHAGRGLRAGSHARTRIFGIRPPSQLRAVGLAAAVANALLPALRSAALAPVVQSKTPAMTSAVIEMSLAGISGRMCQVLTPDGVCDSPDGWPLPSLKRRPLRHREGGDAHPVPLPPTRGVRRPRGARLAWPRSVLGFWRQAAGGGGGAFLLRGWGRSGSGEDPCRGSGQCYSPWVSWRAPGRKDASDGIAVGATSHCATSGTAEEELLAPPTSISGPRRSAMESVATGALASVGKVACRWRARAPVARVGTSARRHAPGRSV